MPASADGPARRGPAPARRNVRAACAVGAWLAWVVWPAEATPQDCPPASTSTAELRALEADGWSVADDARRAALAVALLDCLADPDPELRDRFALGALTRWLRGGVLTIATVRTVGERALAMLTSPQADPDGFRAPFSALVLAEVARVDRQRPVWTRAERQAVVEAATGSLRAIRDYRGFDAAQGWRHAVAHGADLLMQLALNPALDRPALDALLDAVAVQATPSTHFYVFGEGERLARPVIFVARRGLHDEAYWTAWFGRIALAGRVEAPLSPAALARLHNAKTLLLPLYAALQEGDDAALKARLLPGLSAALRTLW
jgi:hypothetical protein